MDRPSNIPDAGHDAHLERPISPSLALGAALVAVALAVVAPPSALVSGPTLIVAALAGAQDRRAMRILVASGALLVLIAAATAILLMAVS